MTKFKLYGMLFILISFLTIPHSLKAKEENKTVNITASGSGATKDAAQQSALRSAIEQTFGVFISSKTEIFNDELVADEIASISSGNIKSFKILNATQLPDGNWGVTLNAIVSVDKLTSFVQSKGISVEIQGGIFAINIKQQLLNEKAEVQAIKQMLRVLEDPIRNSFDFKIKSKEPKSIDGSSNNFGVELIVTAIPNKNMEFITKYFENTLSNIELSESEVLNYKSINKNVFDIYLSNSYNKGHNSDEVSQLNLRTEESRLLIKNFFKIAKSCNTYFKVDIVGLKEIYGADLKFNFSLNSKENTNGWGSNENDDCKLKFYSNFGDGSLKDGHFIPKGKSNWFPNNYIQSQIDKLVIFLPQSQIPYNDFIWTEKFNLEEIEKLKSIDIKPISVGKIIYDYNNEPSILMHYYTDCNKAADITLLYKEGDTFSYKLTNTENSNNFFKYDLRNDYRHAKIEYHKQMNELKISYDPHKIYKYYKRNEFAETVGNMLSVFDGGNGYSAFFKYNSNSNKISEVSLSFGSDWVKYELTGFKFSNGIFSYSIKGEDGYKCKIEYTNDMSELKIIDDETKTQWILTKRKS